MKSNFLRNFISFESAGLRTIFLNLNTHLFFRRFNVAQWYSGQYAGLRLVQTMFFTQVRCMGDRIWGRLSFFPILLVRDLVRHGGVLRHIKMVSFKYFRSLRSVSLRFWTGLGADHTVFWKNCMGMFYNS